MSTPQSIAGTIFLLRVDAGGGVRLRQEQARALRSWIDRAATLLRETEENVGCSWKAWSDDDEVEPPADEAARLAGCSHCEGADLLALAGDVVHRDLKPENVPGRLCAHGHERKCPFMCHPLDQDGDYPPALFDALAALPQPPDDSSEPVDKPAPSAPPLDVEDVRTRAELATRYGDIAALGTLARADVPALCSEVTSLRAEVERLRSDQDERDERGRAMRGVARQALVDAEARAEKAERERDEARAEHDRLSRQSIEWGVFTAQAQQEALRLRAALDAIPCPACTGDGHFALFDEDGAPDGEILCETCGGSGKHPDATRALGDGRREALARLAGALRAVVRKRNRILLGLAPALTIDLGALSRESRAAYLRERIWRDSPLATPVLARRLLRGRLRRIAKLEGEVRAERRKCDAVAALALGLRETRRFFDEGGEIEAPGGP